MEFTGAGVREPTGIALPARYSMREEAADDALGAARPTDAVGLPPWRKVSGGIGLGSIQRPRRAARASDSAAAYVGLESKRL